ncbi:hypothetical protein FVB32_09915 [Flagellimonas hymeniacidonis]|uniref:Lipoprotein n=1 Tax=Flagellimonas hymeniacidonis TaxID=2603628 RepID=A0A5C8V0R8_9FLAO|nr:hypothetical protein [Flagellimonas hymeniacidonis]TXN34906.1 hypothetical protein FVB32_09915 [Flagellimonas hymeniacidonis]
MKNTKKVTPFILGAMLLFLGACQEKPKKEEPHEEPKERVKPPKQIISLETSKELYDNYSKNRAELIQSYEAEENDDENFKAARFASWDFKTIKQYIAFIEQEAKDAKVDISTIRFYYANYPNKKRFPDGKKVIHPRQNSIIILPTMKVDGTDYGFYIGEDGKAKLIKDAVDAKGIGSTSEQNGKSYASFAPNFSAPPALFAGQSLNMNHGNSGPPPKGDF